ncbi:MAG TPA: Ppx/GppA phosphatase family protein [Thermoanaerobaculia bacterium]|nr:Ppx/GppA phosphatase family protein [Thermoanaerobaculia bacterium]
METTTEILIQPLTFPEVEPEPGGTPLPEPAAPSPSRLAAIDVGSNSIHMIVVAPEPNGGYRVLGREREMVRLGRSALGGGGALSETAIRDGLEALLRMTTLARLKGAERVVAVATSAVREAANGAEFLARVKALTGLDVQLLSGIEEGRLIYRAVREVVDLGQGPAALVDVGGGSTEWIATQAGEAARVVSLALGSLRLAANLKGDPPSAAALDRLRRRVERQLHEEVPTGRVERLVATSGTAVCCADLVDLFGGGGTEVPGGLREVRVKDLAQVVERLAGMKRQQIAELPPVGGPRSESILAGAVLLQELVAHAGVERFQVSDRALREGLVLEALGQPIPLARAPEDLRRRQVLQLAERTESTFRHNVQTARLAVRIFDLTASLHSLGAREREWLEYAALLHDIGYSIHYRGHHKHAYYLIINANLDAFDQREIEIIAHVARYHRGATPKPHHPTLRGLKPWQQRTIRRLAVLLRIADSLDRTHASRVSDVFAAIRPNRVRFEVLSPYEVDLELEGAREQEAFFQKVFGRGLRFRQGLEFVED